MAVEDAMIWTGEIGWGIAKDGSHVDIHAETSVVRRQMILEGFHACSCGVLRNKGGAKDGVKSADAAIASSRERGVGMSVCMKID